MKSFILASNGNVQTLIVVAIALSGIAAVFSLLAYLTAKKKGANAPAQGADNELMRDLISRQTHATEFTVQAVNNASQSQKEKMADVERRVFESAQSTERRLLESENANEQRLTNMQKQLDSS